MKKMTLSLLFSTLIFSCTVQAANINFEGNVSNFYISQGGSTVNFKLKNLIQGCAFSGNAYFILNRVNNPNFEESYALLLASAHNGKKVTIKADNLGCSQSSAPSTPVIWIAQNL